MGDVGALVILCGVVGLVFAGFALAKPRETWHVFQGWKYKNPEANEPSDVSLSLSAIGGIIGSIALLVIGVGLVVNGKGDAKEGKYSTSSAYPLNSKDDEFESVGVYGYWNPVEGQFRVAMPGEIFDICRSTVAIREYANAIVVRGESNLGPNGECQHGRATAIVAHTLRAPLGKRSVFAEGPKLNLPNGMTRSRAVVGDGSKEAVAPTGRPLVRAEIDPSWLPLRPLEGPPPAVGTWTSWAPNWGPEQSEPDG